MPAVKRFLITCLCIVLPALVNTTASPDGRPANDDFESAILLAGRTNMVTASNVGATVQTGEPAEGVTRSTWYRWTTPVSGRAQVSLRSLAPLIESQAVVV